MTCNKMNSRIMPCRYFWRKPHVPQLMQKSIQRSCYQVQLWVQAPFRDATLIMNPEMYGFERSGGILVPEMVISKSEGLPDPCKCGKCACKNSCPFRVVGIHCCKYCKCKGGNTCKNPIIPNEHWLIADQDWQEEKWQIDEEGSIYSSTNKCEQTNTRWGDGGGRRN